MFDQRITFHLINVIFVRELHIIYLLSLLHVTPPAKWPPFASQSLRPGKWCISQSVDCFLISLPAVYI